MLCEEAPIANPRPSSGPCKVLRVEHVAILRGDVNRHSRAEGQLQSLHPTDRSGRVEPVRTLDAVHPATAESLGEMPQLITIVTRNDRVRDNATALGYSVE
jgi:hypothetical protein